MRWVDVAAGAVRPIFEARIVLLRPRVRRRPRAGGLEAVRIVPLGDPDVAELAPELTPRIANLRAFGEQSHERVTMIVR